LGRVERSEQRAETATLRMAAIDDAPATIDCKATS
jgi:hypothetical protein